MPGQPFDPTSYLRRVRIGGQTLDYLDVRWRLAWLRADHPDATITSEHIQITPEFAVFRATVQVTGGGAATGYGSARAAAGLAHVEEAESVALGRALLALGYGLAYAPDHVLSAGEAPAAPPPPGVGPASALLGRPVPAQPVTPPADAPAHSAVPSGGAALPAGVTVGPAGGRSLPPRLAAVFAQARPIVDEPLEEPPPLAPAAPATPAVAIPVAGAANATPAAPAEPAVRPAHEGAPVTPPTRTADRARSLAESPPAAVAPVAAEEAEPPSRPTSRPTPRLGAPAPRRSGPTSQTAPATGAGREPANGDQRSRGDDRPRPIMGRPSRPAMTYEDELGEDDAQDDSQADHDWSAFWPWARGKGYFNRDDIERAIGQSIRGRTPRELRTLLMNLDG